MSLTRPDGTMTTVVAVLSSLAWNGGALEPILVAGQVSPANRQVLQRLLQMGIQDPASKIGVEAWQYDVAGKVWFRSFTASPGEMRSTLQKAGATYAISTGAAPGIVSAPPNWPMALAMLPGPVEQTIRLGASSASSAQRKWGAAQK
jgi:hypothetical protein